MTNDEDYLQRTSERPPNVSPEEVRRARSPRNASWWITAIVTIVLVAAIALIYGERTEGEKAAFVETAPSGP